MSSHGSLRPSRVPRGALFVVTLTVAAAAVLSINLGGNDLVAGDEGYYGVMARNVRTGSDGLADVSLSPQGPPGDKPFLFPLVLSAALRVGGVDEIPLRLVTVLSAVLAAPFLYLIGVALRRPAAGVWAAALWLTSPWLGPAARKVAAEPLLVTLALAGVWLFLEGTRRKRWTLMLGSGVLFGLGFLVKLWLVLVPAAAVVAGTWAVAVWGSGPGRIRQREWWRLFAPAAVGFLAAGCLHVALCARVCPEHLSHWRDVYFGFSLLGRASGEAFSQGWRMPFSHYFAVLVRHGCLCVPMAAMGTVALIRRRMREARRGAGGAILLVWFLPLLPMSMMNVKSAAYALPVLPALYLLAGLGIESFGEHLERSSFSRKELAWTVVLGVGVCGVSQVVLTRGNISSGYVCLLAAVVQLLWLISVILAGVKWRSGRAVARLAFAGCLLAAVVGGIGRHAQVSASMPHVTGFARIAHELEPALSRVPPDRLCFISPEWASMSFYTFRTGRYWESPYVDPAPDVVLEALRGDDPFFFVVPTGTKELYGGRPSEESLASIRAEAHMVCIDAPDTLPVCVYVNAPMLALLPER